MVLMFRTKASHAVDAFPDDVYRFPALDEMCTALAAAGFAIELPADATIAQKTAPILIVATKTGAAPRKAGAPG